MIYHALHSLVNSITFYPIVLLKIHSIEDFESQKERGEEQKERGEELLIILVKLLYSLG